jgi:hypothetical protein
MATSPVSAVVAHQTGSLTVTGSIPGLDIIWPLDPCGLTSRDWLNLKRPGTPLTITIPVSTLVVHQTGSLNVPGSNPGLDINLSPDLGVFRQLRQHRHLNMLILLHHQRSPDRHEQLTNAEDITTETLTATAPHGEAAERTSNG